MNKCYLCGSDTTLLYKFSYNDYSIVKCRDCGFLRTFPLPDKNDLKALYGKEFNYDAKQKSEVFRSNLLETIKKNFIVGPLLKNLIKSFKHTENPLLLDIGCSTGWITSTAGKIGFDVKGIEANPNSAKVAREKFGLDVYDGFVEDLKCENSFNAVTLFHVLEHFVDPLSVLLKINSLLMKSGKVLIVVPNAESLGTAMFKQHYNWNARHHISYFSKHSLEIILQKAGFKVLKIVDLPSTPLLLNSFNRMMREREKNEKRCFILKSDVLGNLMMMPIALLGKLIGKGEVLAVYAEKN
ncbi:MAG: class I SAM-dependent methyltransferase [Thermodesulfobacteriota bacterium]